MREIAKEHLYLIGYLVIVIIWYLIVGQYCNDKEFVIRIWYINYGFITCLICNLIKLWLK